MIREELCELIVSWLYQDRKVSGTILLVVDRTEIYDEFSVQGSYRLSEKNCPTNAKSANSSPFVN
jgi:hypothetical protein